MDPEIIEKIPISLAEVKNELSRIKKRDDELSFRGNKTEDYVSSIHVVSEKAAKEMFEKISKLEILRMKPRHIVKFIDIMPTSEQEVKYVADSMNLTVSKDNLKKLFKIIDAYIPKKKK